MKNVYILTEEGKEFSKDGCDLIKNMIKVNFKDEDELTFSMGAVYNRPSHLKSELEKHPDCYIAVSTANGLHVLCGDNVKETILILGDSPNKSSWSSVNAELEKLNTED